MPEATAVVERLTGEVAVPTPEVRMLTVPLRRSDQAVDVLVALREQGIDIDSVSVQKPSLDEVFLALTGHDTGEPTPSRPPNPHPSWRPSDDRPDHHPARPRRRAVAPRRTPRDRRARP